MTAYLDTPDRWDAAAVACRRAGEFGLDTETTGHDVRKSSAAHRAIIHVWSIALSESRRSPRGYRFARGAVFPAVALRHQPWVDLLGDPGVAKDLHNADHDLHALANCGVVLRGWRDTLPLARLLLPERASGAVGPDGEVWTKPPGFGLKGLEVDHLGFPVRPAYRDLVGTTVTRERVTHRPCPYPNCPRPATCLRRTAGHGRERVVEAYEAAGPDIPLEDITPGHPRFQLLCDYAAADAVGARCLRDWLDARAGGVPVVPWR